MRKNAHSAILLLPLKSFFIIFLSLPFLYSCIGHHYKNSNSIQEKTLVESIEQAKEDGKRTFILLCGYRSFYSIRQNNTWINFCKQNIDCSFVYTDISLAANSYIRYLFEFESLPALLSISPQGLIEGIHYWENNAGIVHDVLFAPSEQARYMLLTLAAEALRKEDYAVFSQLIEQVTQEDSFFSNYLLAQYYHVTENTTSCQYYCQKAIANYSKCPDNHFEPLLAQLYNLKDANDLSVLIHPRFIDLGSIPLNTVKETSFTISNFGKEPIFLYQVSTSCSCISLQYPTVIKSGHTASVDLSYAADDTVGDIRQSIYLHMKDTTFTIRLIGKRYN